MLTRLLLNFPSFFIIIISLVDTFFARLKRPLKFIIINFFIKSGQLSFSAGEKKPKAPFCVVYERSVIAEWIASRNRSETFRLVGETKMLIWFFSRTHTRSLNSWSNNEKSAYESLMFFSAMHSDETQTKMKTTKTARQDVKLFTSHLDTRWPGDLIKKKLLLIEMLISLLVRSFVRRHPHHWVDDVNCVFRIVYRKYLPVRFFLFLDTSREKLCCFHCL